MKTSLRTPKLSDLGKISDKQAVTANGEVSVVVENKPFTAEALQAAWNEFAELRKQFQADYHLLSQPFSRVNDNIIIHLHNPVEETILNDIKGDLVLHIRERLQNFSITVTGELMEGEEKKILYTNREKLDYLMEKNPALKDLKERLGLDTDF